MAEKFCRKYHPNGGFIDYDAVRLALEAVFDHIEKVSIDSQILTSKPDELKENYHTVEGHVIEEGKYYKTRNDQKAKIYSLNRNQIFTGFEDSKSGYICDNQGSYFKGQESSLDLMRPWIEQATDKQDNDGWVKHDGIKKPDCLDGKKFEFKCRGGNVEPGDFANLWKHEEQCYDIIAYRIIDEPKVKFTHGKDGILEKKLDEFLRKPPKWITELPENNTGCPLFEKKKESKKQTLLEYVIEKAPHIDRCITQEDGVKRWVFQVISEYLEKNK